MWINQREVNGSPETLPQRESLSTLKCYLSSTCPEFGSDAQGGLSNLRVKAKFPIGEYKANMREWLID
jgi:hypothetical protein